MHEEEQGPIKAFFTSVFTKEVTIYEVRNVHRGKACVNKVLLRFEAIDHVAVKWD